MRYIAREAGENPGAEAGSNEVSILNNHRNGRDNSFSDSELKAVEHSVLGGRRVLWGGVLAVLLPLAILLALQYWWLADLERTSAIARKATLNNYLEAVSREVHYYYYKISERALNLPPEVFFESKILNAIVNSNAMKEQLADSQRGDGRSGSTRQRDELRA